MSGNVARYVRLVLTRCHRDDWRPPVLSRSARHLLEVLSNYANEHGQAFPAVDTLAERMAITAANVRRARAELVAAGVIAVDDGGGRHRTNTYRFPVDTPLEVVHNPRGTARPKNQEEPRNTSTNAVDRKSVV